MKWEGVRKIKMFGDGESAVWSLGMENVGDWGL
jgi:hypothetical protein